MLLACVTAARRGVYTSVNYISVIDKEGNTALHFAVQNGSLNVSRQFQLHNLFHVSKLSLDQLCASCFGSLKNVPFREF